MKRLPIFATTVFIVTIFSSCALSQRPFPRTERQSPQEDNQVSVSEDFAKYETPQKPEIYRNQTAVYYKNVSYGNDDSQKFDLLIPNASGSYPVLIYFHGGGFIAGSKELLYKSAKPNQAAFAEVAKAALNAGIAVVTANYTMLNTQGNKGVISALEDGQRMVKYIKYHAKDFNLDPNRIGVMGGSAGGGIALWLATTEENVTTDQNGVNQPYLQMDPSVVCAAAYNSQSTYDIDKWFNNVYKKYNLSQDQMIVGKEVKRVEAFYNIGSMDEIDSPATMKYRKKIDPMGLLDPNDSPIWMCSPQLNERTPTTLKQMFHHPAMTKAMMERSNELGLQNKNYFQIPVFGIEQPRKLSMAEFLVQELKP